MKINLDQFKKVPKPQERPAKRFIELPGTTKEGSVVLRRRSSNLGGHVADRSRQGESERIRNAQDIKKFTGSSVIRKSSGYHVNEVAGTEPQKPILSPSQKKTKKEEYERARQEHVEQRREEDKEDIFQQELLNHFFDKKTKKLK